MQTRQNYWQHFLKTKINLFSCIVICRQTGITHWAQLQNFQFSFFYFCQPSIHKISYLKLTKPLFGSDLILHFITKKWTIDMQNDPGHHTPLFFKPKYNIHELSDDIRICDFTCQPDLIFIAEKKTNPSQSMQKLLKLAKKLRKKAHFSPMAKQPPYHLKRASIG